MNANVMKTNTGKLLVAVLAMFMIVAGAAVLFSEESSAAEGDTASLNEAIAGMEEGVTTLTLEEGTSYTLSGTIDKTGITIQGSGNTITLPNNATVYFLGTYTFKNVTFVSNWSGTNVAIAMNCGSNSTLNFDGVTFQIGTNTVYVDETNKANFTDCTFTSAGVSFVNTSESTVSNAVTFSGNTGTPNLNVQVTQGDATVSSDGSTGIVVDDETEFGTVSVSNNTTLKVETALVADSIVAADKEPTDVTIKTDNPGNVQASTDIPMESTSGTKLITGVIDTDTTWKDVQLGNSVTIAQGVTVTVTGDLTVPAGCTLTNNGTLTSSNSIIVSDNATFDNNGTVSAIIKDDSGTTSSGTTGTYIQVTNLAGDFTVTHGSVRIEGTISGGDIQYNHGELFISGAINGTVSIIYDARAGPGATNSVIFEQLAINNGGRLQLDDGINYSVEHSTNVNGTDTPDGYVYLYGTIVPYVAEGNPNSGVTISVESKNTFRAYGGAELSSEVTVEPVDGVTDAIIDLSQAQSTLTVSNDMVNSVTYGQLQSIVIDGILSIRNNSTITIQGDLLISEGTVLTIEAGSSLVVNGNVATVTVDGTIEVIDGATFQVIEADDVSITGTVNSYGTVDIRSGVTIEEGGVISINDGDESSISVNGGLTIEAGGELTVSAGMSIDDIANEGTVTLNGAILTDDSTISLTAASAVVNITSVTAVSTATGSYTLTIDDMGLQFADNNRIAGGHEVGKNFNNAMVNPNEVTITLAADEGVSGLIVTEAVTGNGSTDTPYVNDMHISGTVGFVYNGVDDDNVSLDAITVTGDRLYVSESLTLGAGITLKVNGKMTVSGEVYAIAGTGTSASDITIDANGSLTVTGLVQLAANFASDEISKVNAAYYTTAASGTTPAYHWYTNFVDAVAANPATVYVYGEVSVMENVTVPSPMVVRFGTEATLVIGDEDNRDVTVTIANGATVRTGTIEVYGTLYFENKRNDSAGNVISDVRIEGDSDRTYTNIYTALANAESGETVTITINNEDSTVWLTSNLTINEGVTLDVPNTKYIGLENGVTLTVNGTLKTAHAVKVETDFAERASTQLGKEASAIIVNGTFMSMEEMPYDDVYGSDQTIIAQQGYQIPGAYYQVIDSNGIYNYITPVEAAAEVSADATDGYFKIYGDVTSNAVTFTGTDAQAVTVNIMTGQSLTTDSITLSRATLDADGWFTGTVTTAVGSVDVVNTDTIMFVDSFDNDGTETMAVSGTPTMGDADGADASVTIASGNVIVTGSVTSTNTLTITGVEFEIAADTTLTVTDGGRLISEGVAPTDDSTAGAVIVNGTLVATDAGNIDVNYALIFGTLTVAEATSENQAGSASFDYLYAGIAFDYESEGAAAVNGEVTINGYMVVSNEATVDQDMIDSFRNSIVFNVEDVDWITAYSNYAMPITVDYAPIANADLLGWSTADYTYPNDSTTQFGTTVVFNGDMTVYADIDYYIYYVMVIADQGIGTVAIDGQVLTNFTLMGSNVFVLGTMNDITPLDAGQHTISYTLKNNFEGEITMTVNGETVTGNTFTLSGTDAADRNVTINLTGAEPSNPTITVPGDSGDEMGLTDYLLIVLVILIVIMAIIVALRLMRS